MESVNPLVMQGHIPYLLESATRRMQQDLGAIVGRQKFPDLRGSHFRIVNMIPPEGARPSALAATARMTRPALGELVAHLRETGYVTMEPDASDGRAVVVRLTRQGRRAAAETEKAIEELRRRWSSEVGAERIDVLMETLAALTQDTA